LDEAVGVLAPAHIGNHREHGGAERFELLGGNGEPVRVARRDYHGCAVICQGAGGGEADPAAAARDDGHPTGQGLRVAPAPPPSDIAATALERLVWSSTGQARLPGSVRLSRPDSTRPGPTSRNTVAPSRASRSTQSVQRTGLATWATRAGLTSS